MRNKATSRGVWVAACRYLAAGFSILPCHADKRPARGWRELQIKRADTNDALTWFTEQGYQSIGLIGGRVSGGIIFIDLDGIAAIQTFAKAFPTLCETTHSVLTGSQVGIHLYVRTEKIPDNINVRVDGIGGFEIRGNGQYVIAPPSPHPSGNRYRVYRNHQIVTVPDLDDVYDWMASLRESQQTQRQREIQLAARHEGIKAALGKRAYLNKIFSEEIARVETASDGNRNESLFYAGLRLANLAAGGELQWSDCESALMRAALSTGLKTPEIQRTINSAWTIGSKRPRTVK